MKTKTRLQCAGYGKKIKETNEKKYSLEEMSKSLKMNMSERNSVADDAYSIALLFLKMKDKLGIK